MARILKLLETLEASEVPILRQAWEYIEAEAGPGQVAGLSIYGNITLAAETTGVTVTLRDGASASFSENSPFGIMAIEPRQAQVPGSGGMGTITVERISDGPALAASSEAWVAASGSGDVITWTAQANPTTATRTAFITITALLGQSAQTFILTQEAGA